MSNDCRFRNCKYSWEGLYSCQYVKEADDDAIPIIDPDNPNIVNGVNMCGANYTGTRVRNFITM